MNNLFTSSVICCRLFCTDKHEHQLYAVDYFVQINMSIRSSDALRTMMSDTASTERHGDEEDQHDRNNEVEDKDKNDEEEEDVMHTNDREAGEEDSASRSENNILFRVAGDKREQVDKAVLPRRKTKGRRCFGAEERQLIKELLLCEIAACNVTHTTVKNAFVKRPDIVDSLQRLTGFNEKQLQNKVRDSARAVYRCSKNQM